MKISQNQKVHAIVIPITDFPLYRDKYLSDNKIKHNNIKKEYNTQFVGVKPSIISTSEQETVVYMIWTIIYFDEK